MICHRNKKKIKFIQIRRNTLLLSGYPGTWSLLFLGTPSTQSALLLGYPWYLFTTLIWVPGYRTRYCSWPGIAYSLAVHGYTYLIGCTRYPYPLPDGAGLWYLPTCPPTHPRIYYYLGVPEFSTPPITYSNIYNYILLYLLNWTTIIEKGNCHISQKIDHFCFRLNTRFYLPVGTCTYTLMKFTRANLLVAYELNVNNQIAAILLATISKFWSFSEWKLLFY